MWFDRVFCGLTVVFCGLTVFFVVPKTTVKPHRKPQSFVVFWRSLGHGRQPSDGQTAQNPLSNAEQTTVKPQKNQSKSHKPHHKPTTSHTTSRRRVEQHGAEPSQAKPSRTTPHDIPHHAKSRHAKTTGQAKTKPGRTRSRPLPVQVAI